MPDVLHGYVGVPRDLMSSMVTSHCPFPSNSIHFYALPRRCLGCSCAVIIGVWQLVLLQTMSPEAAPDAVRVVLHRF